MLAAWSVRLLLSYVRTSRPSCLRTCFRRHETGGRYVYTRNSPNVRTLSMSLDKNRPRSGEGVLATCIRTRFDLQDSTSVRPFPLHKPHHCLPTAINVTVISSRRYKTYGIRLQELFTQNLVTCRNYGDEFLKHFNVPDRYELSSEYLTFLT